MAFLQVSLVVLAHLGFLLVALPVFPVLRHPFHMNKEHMYITLNKTTVF